MKSALVRSLALSINLLLITVVGPTTAGWQNVWAAENFTPEKIGEIEKIVRDYILKNPGIIVEAIEILRAQQKETAADRTRQMIVRYKDDIFKDRTAPIAGNADGDVIVVEYFDYQCPYCKRVAPIIRKLLKEDRNIKYVFKEFPILGPVSKFAARAALAAWKQNRETYVPFHDALMDVKGKLTEKRVMRLADKVGLDVKRLKIDMEADEIGATIERNIQVARKLNINATPTFIIGDTVVPGAADERTLKTLIERARKSGFSKKL